MLMQFRGSQKFKLTPHPTCNEQCSSVIATLEESQICKYSVLNVSNVSLNKCIDNNFNNFFPTSLQWFSTQNYGVSGTLLVKLEKV